MKMKDLDISVGDIITFEQKQNPSGNIVKANKVKVINIHETVFGTDNIQFQYFTTESLRGKVQHWDTLNIISIKVENKGV